MDGVILALIGLAIACAANTIGGFMILRALGALTRAHETWQEGVE
jgi:hypothetical protein